MERKSILVTGGAGFIGSHVVKHLVRKYPNYVILNVDALTYAGNLENLKEIENEENYVFFNIDLRDREKLFKLIHGILNLEGVIHLAAESHVDRSIGHPMDFVQTNIIGTVNLLDAVRAEWERNGGYQGKKFLHVSTDEVFGALGEEGQFTEETPYNPHSPYSASKAASDHMVRAYHDTYGMPTVITNCSNNYGPNQFPEKLIPLCIQNILEKKPLPIYGDGLYTRDWLYVLDHVQALETVYFEGKVGESYNIGGFNEWTNIDLVRELCAQMDEKLDQERGTSESLIEFVKDRPGHDLRYAIDATKISTELGWTPEVTFAQGLSYTIDWYLQNRDWLERVNSGAYRDYEEISEQSS
ncbi:MAG TPA: dTDP-glucose 4,6-dehydratase [Candidatus Sphingobacterium stercorigallinarum]|nr:dTDP-glucose 4,6-dehydratase [Candidatus Sphingobacterium stercorigallinarum]